MPFKDPARAKKYQQAYSQERGVGLRRSGAVGEVVALMEERREADRERVRTWCAAHRERRNAQQRERRRAARQAQMEAALRVVSGTGEQTN